MADICSRIAFDEITNNGYVGKRQAQYLWVFMGSQVPLTHIQATKKAQSLYGIKLPERNGRIAELEEMGFLEKVDTVVCEFTHHLVNRWKWTGRTKPFVSSQEIITCHHCGGSGKLVRKVYSGG